MGKVSILTVVIALVVLVLGVVLFAGCAKSGSKQTSSGSGSSSDSGSGSGPGSGSGSGPVAQYHKITAAQAKAFMNDGEAYTLVDVRTAGEYKAGHIAGAKLIPNTEIQSRSAKDLPDKSARILVYCRSGARSSGAARALVGLGYTNVYDLGGLINWPYGTVKD